MERMKRIACFEDTLRLAESGMLRAATQKARKTNRIYREHFVSEREKKVALNANGKPADIIVETTTTFAAAKKYGSYGKSAVLNFANPEHPGGGVRRGAMAQEECLCRSSNLFLCLSDSNVYEDYYEYHRNWPDCFYSDRLIYTEGVTVFKDDNELPRLMPENEWFTVDVITCAAPYLADVTDIDPAALALLFRGRIKNIFEAAREMEVDVLILGAFGCGAFANPPSVVAEAFWQVICEEHYADCFSKIIFAIKPTCEHCKNVEAFRRRFG